MKLEYSLTNEDFLEHQLYEASKSKRVKSKRFKTRIITPIIYLILGLVSFASGYKILFPLIMFLFAILWYLFYPTRSRKIHIKHYNNHIKDTYKNRINKPIEIEFNKDYVYIEDNGSESKIKTSELKSLIELKNHFLIKLKTDLSLIVPKREINNIDVFKTLFVNLNIPIIEELNWIFK